ncbi:MAG: hypothetical protein LUG99_15710 [Lachnospiraceae bacterium]|nr:hypothetical protein [Lachnospiraceae bacterium]
MSEKRFTSVTGSAATEPSATKPYIVEPAVAEPSQEMFQTDSGFTRGIHTEQQLWDEIFKKELYEMPFLLLPLLYEIYGMEYPRETPVTPIATEFSVESPDTKEITSIRSDMTLKVALSDIFHFECEISTDPDMSLRMYDYDSRVALTYPVRQKKIPILLKYPHSAILYLKPGVRTPEPLTCRLYFPPGKLVHAVQTQNSHTNENAKKSVQRSEAKKNQPDTADEVNTEARPSVKASLDAKNLSGTEDLSDNKSPGTEGLTDEISYVDYLIPVVKVQAYSLQQIREKHLLILIPFTPIRFRPLLKRMKKEPTFAKNELTNFYQEIILTLDEAVTDGYISEQNRKCILSLLQKAMIRVFNKTTFLSEVIHMTAPVLEFEWETVERLEKEIAVLKEENAKKDAIMAEKDAEIRALRKRRWGIFYGRRKEG